MAEKKKKVLIVDDEDPIREVLADVLREEGYAVGTAKDGEEALAIVKKIRPDLILLDMSMPNMGGVSFYKQLSSPIDGSVPIPVMILTGRADMGPIMEELGVTAFMAKPFDTEKLLGKVREILGKQHLQTPDDPAK